MRKQDFLIIGAGLTILALIILLSFILPSQPKEEPPEEVEIITDNGSYNVGDSLKIKIENNLEEEICFSSCYPYYFERKNGNWIDYNYVPCSDGNMSEYCINPKGIKAFELVIPGVKEGTHRIALSACVGCNFNESFEEDKIFYSNPFIIK
ncbi:MAG: hypothetical protein Q8N58_01080 [bacterium]|nr:hypothetical protein [bacterium]